MSEKGAGREGRYTEEDRRRYEDKRLETAILDETANWTEADWQRVLRHFEACKLRSQRRVLQRRLSPQEIADLYGGEADDYGGRF